jgi:hypothetical protein
MDRYSIGLLLQALREQIVLIGRMNAEAFVVERNERRDRRGYP